MTSRSIPYLTTEQMREVDRLMIEEYGITLFQMMENAGRALARVARERFLQNDPREQRVVILAGIGGNAGGGLVCARNLHNWGAAVDIYLSSPVEDLDEVPQHQLAILERLGVSVTTAHAALDLPEAELVIDALIGYSLQGSPRGVTATLVRAANDHRAPKLALDVPSGVDAGTGTVYEPAVRADATLTLALPKEGLRAESAKENVGELYLADIGVPPELYKEPSVDIRVRPIFAEQDILRVF